MTECNVCHRALRSELTTYPDRLDDRWVLVQNVPTWVCEQCGETYYDPDVVEQIQNLIWSGAEPVRTMETAVYDLLAI